MCWLQQEAWKRISVWVYIRVAEVTDNPMLLAQSNGFYNSIKIEYDYCAP